MDLNLFREILEKDSTSGKERAMAEWLATRLEAPSVQKMEVGDGTLNLLFSWGTPKVVFCTHMDTVPPFIPPVFLEDRILGRGSCDAKGQILAMYSACKRLEAEGLEGFGLLLLAGEETGSHGAKAFAKTLFRAPYLIVGEPTENKMVSACKGTQSFSLTFGGEAFHSGYPQFGRSAVDMFVKFCNALRDKRFPEDPILGSTTWNVGKLISDNPQNVLSPELSCRLYFRTTFASHDEVRSYMELPWEHVSVGFFGGDTPAKYFTIDGFPSAPVSFGSDAPHLTNFTNRAICGPGTVRVAHRDNEYILLRDLEEAVDMYVKMFKAIC